MSYSDELFIKMCNNVLENGTIVPSRALWKDTGEHAKIIKTFGIVNIYDLSKEFPANTLRPVGFKNCIDEILWIWQNKSNNIKDLNSHIWDSWADDNGSIGSAYGYQIRSKLRKVKREESYTSKSNPQFSYSEVKESFVDQTDFVLHELKYNTFSRRIVTNMYDIDDLPNMGLEPCAYSLTFNVTKENNELVLNAILNQRSQDILVANNWNVVQYSILLHMFAISSNMKVGKLIHVISDAHIYDRHIDIVKELITRPTYDAPKLYINPDVNNFYDFKVDDFKLIDYKTGNQIRNIPVAI